MVCFGYLLYNLEAEIQINWDPVLLLEGVWTMPTYRAIVYIFRLFGLILRILGFSIDVCGLCKSNVYLVNILTLGYLRSIEKKIYTLRL